MKRAPILYVRPECPWCREAMDFFSSHGVEVEVRDVDQSYPHLRRMIEVSGQSNTPTFEWGDFVASDFSVDELLDELRERPDVRMRLGIADNNPSG